MKKITVGQIETAVSGRLLRGNRGDFVSGVSTRSGSSKPGDIFFALIGEKHDAHCFIEDAVKNGAGSIVVSKDTDADLPDGLNIVKVSDTTRALQDLAKWYVSELNIKKIGITGSTGKTTTKDILYYICNEKFKTGKTPGNLNNHIGLPMTIFSFDEDVEVGVLEMGTETLGEIHLLADIVKPDIAIITNIGIMHIETFGGRENIFKGKMEITDFFGGKNLLIVNEESDMLTRRSVAGNYGLITVGKSGKSDFILSDITEYGEDGVEFTLEHMRESRRFKLGIPGRHNAVNASLALAAAFSIGVGWDEAERGLKKVQLTEKRLNIRGKGGVKVIDDTYNAGPDSVRAAIDVLISTKGMRKVAILGDMLGLGDDSRYHHEQIGEYAAGKGIDLLITTGEMSKYTADKARESMGADRVIYYPARGILETDIKNIVTPGDVVLLKGSRATAMDRVAAKILE